MYDRKKFRSAQNVTDVSFFVVHVPMYHRRLLSNEWMTSVPTMSRHVFPPANDDFTRGKSPLVGAVNGLSDPKPDPIA